jgi:hypothetical protein
VFAEDSITQITQRSEDDVRALMNTLFTQISILREKCGASLNKPTLLIIDGCLACWENLTDKALGEESMYSQRMKKLSQTAHDTKSEKARRPSVVAEIQQIYYRKHFGDFVNRVCESKNRNKENEPNDSYSTDIFERLPSIYDPTNADLRLEPFILKIATHIRNKIIRSRTARSLEKDFVDSSIWMIQTLKMIIRKSTGVSRDNMFEKSVDQQEVEFTYYSLAMNDYGIVYMCLDFIAVGIDSALCVEAIELLVMLLCKSSGRMQIQYNIQHVFPISASHMYFIGLCRSL